MIVSKTFILLTVENISPFEVQTPESGIWKNPGSETLLGSSVADPNVYNLHTDPKPPGLYPASEKNMGLDPGYINLSIADIQATYS